MSAVQGFKVLFVSCPFQYVGYVYTSYVKKMNSRYVVVMQRTKCFQPMDTTSFISDIILLQFFPLSSQADYLIGSSSYQVAWNYPELFFSQLQLPPDCIINVIHVFRSVSVVNFLDEKKDSKFAVPTAPGYTPLHHVTTSAQKSPYRLVLYPTPADVFLVAVYFTRLGC